MTLLGGGAAFPLSSCRPTQGPALWFPLFNLVGKRKGRRQGPSTTTILWHHDHAPQRLWAHWSAGGKGIWIWLYFFSNQVSPEYWVWTVPGPHFENSSPLQPVPYKLYSWAYKLKGAWDVGMRRHWPWNWKRLRSGTGQDHCDIVILWKEIYIWSLSLFLAPKPFGISNVVTFGSA